MCSIIVLVGPMGSGKSTIGRQLANALKKEFRDSDHEIVARTGASIPLIFEIEGEEGFRKREAAMIDELTQLDGIVLATGGGAVLREENRKHLTQRGVVLYLYASVEQLFERTSRDHNRPLLQTENPRQKLQHRAPVLPGCRAAQCETAASAAQSRFAPSPLLWRPVSPKPTHPRCRTQLTLALGAQCVH